MDDNQSHSSSVATKRCTKCGVVQSVESFTRDRQRRDGLYPQCRLCCTRANRKIKVRASLAQNPPTEKACSRCGVVQPRANYYDLKAATDGKRSHCKTCHKAICAEWSSRNQRKANESRKRWSERNPNKVANKTRSYRARNPEKYRAHWIVQYHVKKGNIVPPTACERCGAPGRLDAHHDDYSKPLEVRWLCPPCHGLTRRQSQHAELIAMSQEP